MIQLSRPQIEALVSVDEAATEAVRDAYRAISDGPPTCRRSATWAFPRPMAIATSNSAISPEIRSLPSRSPQGFMIILPRACPPAQGLSLCFRP